MLLQFTFAKAEDAAVTSPTPNGSAAAHPPPAAPEAALSDADITSGRRYSAKVMMLLGCNLDVLLAEDPSRCVPLASRLSFLMGKKGRLLSTKVLHCLQGGCWQCRCPDCHVAG